MSRSNSQVVVPEAALSTDSAILLQSWAADGDTLAAEVLSRSVELAKHPIYKDIGTLERTRVFMRYHIWCVWDFMSLAKAVQTGLGCFSIPWIPPKHPDLTRAIGEKRAVLKAAGSGDDQDAADIKTRRSQARDLQLKVRRWAAVKTELQLTGQFLAAARPDTQNSAAPDVGRMLGVASALLIAFGAVAAAGLLFTGQHAAGWITGSTCLLIAGALFWLRTLSAAPAHRTGAQDLAPLMRSNENLQSEGDELASVIGCSRREHDRNRLPAVGRHENVDEVCVDQWPVRAGYVPGNYAAAEP